MTLPMVKIENVSSMILFSISVYVPYCSSDFHSGTANASDDTEGRVFHGKYIFKAVISDLMANTWLAQADEVVLVGTSAGSIGVERNCDWMADQLKAVKPDMDVKCIIDSGTLVPIDTYNEFCLENGLDVQEGQVYWEAELDETCMANNPDACGSLTGSWPYLETTSMIITSATDSNTISSCNNFNDDVFLQPWRDELAQLLRNITDAKPDFGVYVENCPFHTAVQNVYIMFAHEVPVEDGPNPGEMKHLQELLANFWNQDPPKVGIDNMDALNPKCNNNG